MARKKNEELEALVERVTADVRGAVWNCARDLGVTQEKLVEVTRLNPMTVSNFGDGTTKSPHFKTVARLAGALELEIYVGRRQDGVLVPLGQMAGKVRSAIPKRRQRRS